MTSTQPHCALSLDQVDALNWAAYRIVLYGNLVMSILDDQWKEGELINEGLQELVATTIEDANTILALVEGTADCPAGHSATV